MYNATAAATDNNAHCMMVSRQGEREQHTSGATHKRTRQTHALTRHTSLHVTLHVLGLFTQNVIYSSITNSNRHKVNETVELFFARNCLF